MTKASLLLSLSFILLLVQVSAQNYPRKKFSWEENRKISYQETALELTLSGLVILDERFVDYALGFTERDHNELFVTEHKIIRVNDDAGINQFNKMYVQLFPSDELVKIGARTILPNGTIKEVPYENMKDIKNYEQYGNFKVFALEGVMKGSEIEYYYTIKRKNFQDGILTLQNPTKVKQQSVTITYPDELEVESKSYNGFPPLKVIPDERLTRATATALDIAAPTTKEMYAAKRANDSKIAYKIVHYKNWPDQLTMGWYYILYFIHKEIFDDWNTPKIADLAIADKLKGLSQEEQIKAIDNYIKTNYRFKSDPSWEKEYSKVEYVVKKKIGSEIGLAKLYAAYYTELKIPFDIVVTSDRYDSKFDPKFPDYHNLREIVFFFRQYKKFVIPSYQQYRFGPVPPQFVSNYGLSITSKDSGNIVLLKASEPKLNKTIMDINMEFHMDSMYASIQAKHRWLGYPGVKLRGDYQLLSPDDKQKLVNHLVTRGVPVMDLDEADIINMDITDSTYYQPVTLMADMRTASLFDRGGNNILFSIGKLIGQQAELYNDTIRVNEIEKAYPEIQSGHIKFTIPTGYKIKGLEELKINKDMVIDGASYCSFSSDYVTNNNEVHVTYTEQYNIINYPKDHYKEFRQVVNAAADFSKVELVLEKE